MEAGGIPPWFWKPDAERNAVVAMTREEQVDRLRLISPKDDELDINLPSKKDLIQMHCEFLKSFKEMNKQQRILYIATVATLAIIGLLAVLLK